MIKYQSGLEALLARQSFSQTGNCDVIISERRDVRILQLSFFANQTAALETQLRAFGISALPSFSQVKTAKGVSAARVEMEKIWLISDDALAGIDTALYPLDLSAARNVIRVSGARAADVMARICAVDFRDKTRAFYATSMHHVGIHIHHHNDVFDLYLPRSFAESLTELLIDISAQYHVQMA